MSHPTWVCGLKQPLQKDKPGGLLVTPYVGVWIETLDQCRNVFPMLVTPYVGVWIETMSMEVFPGCTIVTPYVGVWIETWMCNIYKLYEKSHPTWVCGLKL